MTLPVGLLGELIIINLVFEETLDFKSLIFILKL